MLPHASCVRTCTKGLQYARPMLLINSYYFSTGLKIVRTCIHLLLRVCFCIAYVFDIASLSCKYILMIGERALNAFSSENVTEVQS